MKIVIGVAEGLNYLHNNIPGFPVYHGDIKAANIAIMADYTPKILDFGMSKFKSVESSTGENSMSIHSVIGAWRGSKGYMDPKYLKYHDFDAKTEIYSFGILVYEILTGQLQTRNGFHLEDEIPKGPNSDMHKICKVGEYFEDLRAGDWPNGCAKDLQLVARNCVLPYDTRPIKDMREVIHPLNIIRS
jgi:serine/threonine protein kinase